MIKLLYKLFFYVMCAFGSAIVSMFIAVFFCSYFEIKQAGFEFHAILALFTLLGMWLLKKCVYSDYMHDAEEQA